MDGINYHFTVTGLDRYEIVFSMKAKNALVDKVFMASKKALGARGVVFDGSPDSVTRFEVPEQYLASLHTALGRYIKKVSREVAKDGITMLNSRVSRALFVKNDGWSITVHVVGDFIDKR